MELVSSLCVAEKLGFLSAMEVAPVKGTGVDRSDSTIQEEICRFGRGEFKRVVF